MKIEVTLHIDLPDDMTNGCDLSSSKDIIETLKSVGVAEEITGPDDTIVNAKIL